MTPPPLTLTEGGPSRLVELSLTEYEALRRLAIVEITPTLEQNWYEVASGRGIGAVSVGGRQVIIRPKIADLNRLVFLLGYATNPSIWRGDRVQLAEADELLPALAEAFSRLASHALEQGPLMGYSTVTETLPVLRGRVLAGEQMTRRYGLPVPLAVEYDDFTIDIVENRLLLLAALRLLSVPRITESARRRLQRLRLSLADVTILPRGIELPPWQPTRLNARYHAALQLAQVVLAAKSFEHRIGDLTVSGFMFDMWRIYEDFVTTALAEAFNLLGGRSRTQHRVHMDEAEAVVMKPDLVWLGDGGAPLAVVDAKYKAERPDGFPDADLYQMLAYCTVLGLPEGHLVYAKGNEPVRSHDVRRSGVVIHCHALDLTVEPRDLLQEVDRLARLIGLEREGRLRNERTHARTRRERLDRAGCEAIGPDRAGAFRDSAPRTMGD